MPAVLIRLDNGVVIAEVTAMENGVVTIARQQFDTQHTARVTPYDTEAHNEQLQ